MAYWHISEWTKRFYPGVIWDKRESGKKLFLTFDDGPTPGVTEQILDILDRFGAKGTFFCLGRNVERHPKEFTEILKRGHAVGNHTYSHLRGWRTKNEDYYEDIQLGSQLIDSKLFRPPYGQIRRSQIRHLNGNYKIILWEVMSHDYENRVSKEKSLKAVLRYTKEGSILVFHDSLKAWSKLEYILPRVLEEFSERGFRFEKLEE
jgi:peptidoglycan/xylan/chitin deacetylase (PgdA/CDA1 family)